MTDTDLPEFVEIAEGLPAALRVKLRLADGEKLRLSYLSLANDVARVQRFWAEGKGDPRSQKATYAGMFFELVEKLDAEGLLVSLFDTEPPSNQPVKIGRVDREVADNGGKSIVDQVAEHVRDFRPHLVVISPSIPGEIVPKVADVCPTVYYAHSLLWPVDWGHRGAPLKARLRKFVRALRSRRNLTNISGILASSNIALEQALGVSKGALPMETARNQFIFPPKSLCPSTARRILFIGEFESKAGVDLLVSAFREVRAKFTDATLTMIGTGPKNEELSRLGESLDGLSVQVGFDAESHQQALENSDLVVVSDFYSAMKALPTYLPEALISGIPALISSATPANMEELAHCETYQWDDPDDLVRQLKRLMLDDAAFQKLQSILPMDASPYFDRSQSWGSGIARLLAKIYGIS